MKPQNQDYEVTQLATKGYALDLAALQAEAARTSTGHDHRDLFPNVCPTCDGWAHIGGSYFGAPDNEACPDCNGTGIIEQPSGADEPNPAYQRRKARPGYELTSQDAPARRIKVQQRATSYPAGPRSTRRTVTVPSLTLTGQWLEWCGLTPGAVAYIEVNPSSLVITAVPAAAATPSRAEEPAAGYGDAAQFQPVLLTPEGPTPVTPLNGTDFKLAQLYELIGCQRVEVVYLGESPYILLIDEEGTYPADAQRNPLAEAIWWQYEPHAHGQPLYGRALWCHTNHFR